MDTLKDHMDPNDKGSTDSTPRTIWTSPQGPYRFYIKDYRDLNKDHMGTGETTSIDENIV